MKSSDTPKDIPYEPNTPTGSTTRFGNCPFCNASATARVGHSVDPVNVWECDDCGGIFVAGEEE